MHVMTYFVSSIASVVCVLAVSQWLTKRKSLSLECDNSVYVCVFILLIRDHLENISGGRGFKAGAHILPIFRVYVVV